MADECTVQHQYRKDGTGHIRRWGQHRITNTVMILANLPVEQFPFDRIASATPTSFGGGKQYAKTGIKGVNES